jgi:tetratricopeptide (TPR) repeat protein
MILLAITGALGVATVHCLFDFPMHLPLYAVVLASLVGLALPIPAPPPRNRWFLALSPVFLGLLASAVLALHPASRLRLLDAEEYLAQAAPADLRDALVSAPTSWHAWYYLGRRSCRQGVDERKLALCFFGEELMSRALALDPQNYRLWYWVGKTRLILRDHEGAQAAFARAQALRPWLTPPPLERRP